MDNYVVYKGTLAFEDLWPSKGDYDMNDVVVEYYSVVMKDAQNRVVGMIDSLTPRWSGASFHNAFGYELDLPYSMVSSGYVHSNVRTNYSANAPVDDQSRVSHSFRNDGDRFSFDANGFEMGQSKAVMIVFDDIKADGEASVGRGAMVPDYNDYNRNGRKPDPDPQYWFRVSTKFGELAPTVADSRRPAIDKVTPPYNPFIVVTYSEDVNKDSLPYSRGKEIHLVSSISNPDKYKPTSLALAQGVANWFQTGDDRSEPASGYYFLSNQGYPWAINIPVYQWNFPMESKKVDDSNYGYPDFAVWASSNGTRNTDWYLPENAGSDIGTLGGDLLPTDND